MALHRRTIWLTSIAASVLLLGLVVAQVDWAQAQIVLDQLSYIWLFAGVFLLLIEGLITAARLNVLARPVATYRACVTTTAWYVLLLIALPARLGEIAGVATLAQHMGQRAGTAAASLLLQRLFDILLLALMLAAVSVLWAAGPSLSYILWSIACLILVLLGGILYLERLLACLALPLLKSRSKPWARRILRVILQARILRRHYLDRARTVRLGCLTLAKWLANLSAIACVVIGVVPALSTGTAYGLGIVYNLSAVIPIQTIGGFGISEAVLMGSFHWLGYSLEIGAPIALTIRLALISAPILFWVIAIGTKDSGNRPD